ncbi:MAG: ribosome biogenesis GTPase YlqF [Clostridiales bacterium]|nr:ribosome biogenesis GTPase YlqF [Clostridiales bacterium]
MRAINWYPGHMKKTRELIEANLKLVDVVCEVCDARIPASSRNPVLGELTTGKPRVLILNKSDLADEEATKAWLGYLRGGAAQTGQAPVHASFALNAMSGQGVKALFGGLERIAAEKAATGTGRALIPLRLMVVGIPNSGKSSLINRLTGRRAAQVGDRPGVTRGKQWLTLENGMQLLDTPGILWPKFEDPDVGLNLAFCGSIRDEIMDIADLGLELIRILARDYAGMLAERYGTQGDGFSVRNSLSTEEALLVMEGIARRRGFVLSGNRIDYERTARTVLDEFRSGKIGRITLEQPPLMYEAKRTV